MARDWRDDRIDELEAVVRTQGAVIDEQQRTIAKLEGRVVDLESQLNRTSRNSSVPPSSDPPGLRPAGPPKRAGRRRGGQRGHTRHKRQLVPPEQVTRTEELKPHTCRRCGKALSGEDPAPHRHQVIDIPKVVALVEEYRLHSLGCPECGIKTRAALPAGVAATQFGPRLQAMVSVCSGDYKMSKREIERLVEDFFGIPIALGSISDLEQATSEAIAVPVAQVIQAVQQEPVVHADETGWFEQRKRSWLWVAMSQLMAVFLVRTSRGAEVAKELLGEGFAGVLCSDRWGAYTWVDPTRRQLCWAHLVRQFRGFQDFGGEATKIGQALELLAETMFHLWHQVRNGTLSRAELQGLILPLSQHVSGWLERGKTSGIRKVARSCKEILKLEAALWTFAYLEGVEPTNNAAERSLRPGVLWRKRSFGTDSPGGSRFVERILTAVTTLRLQHRNVLDYMTAACQARLRSEPPPSLLPS